MIAGIDYSLTGPSLCIGDGDFTDCKFFILSKPSKDLEHLNTFSNITVKELIDDYENYSERYERVALFFLEKLLEHNIKEVNIEGYAYAAKGKVFNLAEHTGLLKYLLWKNDIQVNVIEPSKAKKFATGKGNANKALMNEAFEKWTGVKLVRSEKKIGDSPYSDIIDSFFIARFRTL